MKKNKKVLLFLIILIFLLIIFFIIFDTYAKYLSSASSVANMSIARWNIKVNNISISNNTDISSTITPIFPGNEHIASNIVAPTAEGYFDLSLDFTDVDVSFSYTISTTIAENSPVKDFAIVGYSIDNAPKITFSNDDEKIISENILLTDDIKNKNIRIFVKWIDDDSQTMDNSADTLASLSNAPAIFNVNINFSQYIN